MQKNSTHTPPSTQPSDSFSRVEAPHQKQGQVASLAWRSGFIISSLSAGYLLRWALLEVAEHGSTRVPGALVGAAGLIALGLVGGWALLLRFENGSMRLASGACLLTSLALLLQLKWTGLDTTARFVSQASSLVSLELMGQPILALFLSWMIVAQTWLVGVTLRQALSVLLDPPQTTLQSGGSIQSRFLGWLLPGAFLAVHLWIWLSALLGYASGSPDLLLL